MSKNNLRVKEEKRKLKALKKLTFLWNMQGMRIIDGQSYPFQRPYRNFVSEEKAGKIKVIKSGKKYSIEGIVI